MRLLLAPLLLLAACDRAASPPAAPPEPASKPAPAPVPAQDALSQPAKEVQFAPQPAWCLASATPETHWRLAAPADFLPAALPPARADGVPWPCPAIAGDFDADGAPDQALLEVSGRQVRLRFVLAAGPAPPPVGWPPLPEAAGPPVYTFASLKPAGEAVLREYAPPEVKALTPRDALEVCAPGSVDSAGLPADMDPSTLCYCSRFLWVQDGALQEAQVCD